MTPRVIAALLLGALATSAPVARADGPGDPEEVRAGELLREANAAGTYTFCAKPKKPMLPRHAELCPLADEIEACGGFAKACSDRQDPTPPAWIETLARLLLPIAPFLLWGVLVVIVLAIAVPIVLALMRARRELRSKREKVATNAADVLEVQPLPALTVDDAEAALRAADEHARRGDGLRAVSLYLAASLVALERRGAVRRAKHRTNGEYVRSCADPDARPALREVVREVDRATYGKQVPSSEVVARVAERATRIVRQAATAATVVTTLLAALVLTGCDGLGGTGTDDPAGDQLPVDLLGRAGYRIERLGRSVSSLPMPDEEEGEEPRVAEILLVDSERVALEDESRAHLLRWVEHGGTLVLLGDASTWPDELGATVDGAAQRALSIVRVTESDDGTTDTLGGARLARAHGLAWKDARVVAWAGKAPFAAIRRKKEGVVLGIASHDLFTNVGVSRPANAAALFALVDHAVHATASEDETTDEATLRDERSKVRLRVARPEDGIPPPSSPFASLLRAGLGTGSFHALAAAVVLFLAFGIRHARPRPERAPARRAFTEHVEATGAFYERAGTFAHALAAYGAFVEARLRDRAPRGVAPATFLAHRAGVPEEEARALLDRALAAKPEDEPRGDELATIRALRDLYAKTQVAGGPVPDGGRGTT